jgi:hypothetical protein
VPLRDELARLLLRNLSENREDPDGFDAEKFDRDRKAKPVELQKHLGGAHDESSHGQRGQAPKVSERIKQVGGGFTYQPVTGLSPKTGFAVSPFREAESVVDVKGLSQEEIEKVRTVKRMLPELDQYVERHWDRFSDPTVHVGGWHDSEAGKYYLDLSVVVDSQEKASIIAKEHKQEGVYDLEAGRTIIVKPEEERRKSDLGDSSSPEGQEPGGEGGTQAGAEGSLPELDSEREVGKGSAASGHWGHESVEGQHGGSAPGIGSVVDELGGHKKWLKLRGKKLDDPGTANEVRTAIGKLRKFHKIVVSKEHGVGEAGELAVHQAIAQMPAPVRRALKDMGVSVIIKNRQTGEPPSFEVGGQQFVQGGSANYGTGTITIWNDPTREPSIQHSSASDLASHEIGHFVVQSIMGRAVEEEARAEKAHEDHELMVERIKNQRRDFRARTGREPSTGDDPELDRLETARERLFEIKETAQKAEIRGLVRAFGEATLDEGGVTEYSHSYVKATKGPFETRSRNDVWESTDPEFKTLYQQRSGTGSRAFISRAANENFAEIVAKGMFPAGVGGSEPMSQRVSMKLFAQNFPRTIKAFKRLWAVANRSDRIPSHFRAV